jgi:hypothetical protein
VNTKVVSLTVTAQPQWIPSGKLALILFHPFGPNTSTLDRYPPASELYPPITNKSWDDFAAAEGYVVADADHLGTFIGWIGIQKCSSNLKQSVLVTFPEIPPQMIGVVLL